MLDDLAEIRVATAYEVDGERGERRDPFPCHAEALDAVTPGLPGAAGLANKRWAPSNGRGTCRSRVRSYLDFIEEFTGARISHLSVGGERRQTIEITAEQEIEEGSMFHVEATLLSRIRVRAR